MALVMMDLTLSLSLWWVINVGKSNLLKEPSLEDGTGHFMGHSAAG